MDDDVAAFVGRNAGIFLVPVRIIFWHQSLPPNAELLKHPHVVQFLQALGGFLILNSRPGGGGHYVAARFHPVSGKWLRLDSFSATTPPPRFDDPFSLIHATVTTGFGALLLPVCPSINLLTGGLISHPFSDACARVLRACCYLHTMTGTYLDSGLLDLSTVSKLILPPGHPEAQDPEETLSTPAHRLCAGREGNLLTACGQTMGFLAQYSRTIDRVLNLELTPDEDGDGGDPDEQSFICSPEGLRLACVVDLRLSEADAEVFCGQVTMVINAWVTARAEVMNSIFLEASPGAALHGILLYILTLWTSRGYCDKVSFGQKILAFQILLRVFAHEALRAQYPWMMAHPTMTLLSLDTPDQLVFECGGLDVVTKLFGRPFQLPADPWAFAKSLVLRVHSRLSVMVGLRVSGSDLWPIIKETLEPLLQRESPDAVAFLLDRDCPDNDVPLYNCVASRNLADLAGEVLDPERGKTIPLGVLPVPYAQAW
jgi:hypothetical protein